MNRIQPNWDSLADINFLMRRRLIEHLNAAIGAVNVIGTPEAGAKPDEFWKTHAIRHIMRAQNLYDAWNMLIRYKAGQRLTHISQFRAGDLLEWLASETHQTYLPRPDHDRVLAGNRETLQEALLLIHSAAYSIGPGVQLLTESKEEGFSFRVRYQDRKRRPMTLETLLEQLGDDWRTESAAYELQRAQDFLEMNDYALTYTRGETYCELGFFVTVVAAARSSSNAITDTQPIDDTAAVANPNDEETHPSGDDIRSHFSRRGHSNSNHSSRTEN
jgi:hypothetical protein